MSVQFKGGSMRGTARQLCKQMDVKVRPTNEKCGPMETHAINVIANLIKIHGMENMVVTLRILTESHRANRSQLNRNVITAVNNICRLRRFTDRGLALVEAFDDIDLGAMHADAKAEPLSTIHNARTVLACKLINRLDDILGPSPPSNPPKPPKVRRDPKPPRALTRVPGVEAMVDLGVKLLELRSNAKSNREFGRLRNRLFDVDTMTGVRAMMVARVYGDRPEIYRRLSWKAIRDLASPSMPPSLRRNLEARILAGERIGGPQIRAARQGMPQNRIDRRRGWRPSMRYYGANATGILICP
jgi:hypothetical protein